MQEKIKHDQFLSYIVRFCTVRHIYLLDIIFARRRQPPISNNNASNLYKHLVVKH